MRHRIGDVLLNVIDEGEGDTILFLHGLGGSWRDWTPQVDDFRDTHRVVVVEHRGHGRSHLGDEPLSTARFAADALDVCRGLGVDRAHVVGLSMGGLIAQQVALTAPPGFVDTLTLCDTGAYMPERMGAVLLAMAEGVRAAGGMPVTRGVVPADDPAWARATLADHPETYRDSQREAQGNDPEAWARAARAVAEHDTRADLGRITVPTLLVYGEEDRLIRPDKASPPLLAGLPDVEMLIVPDAGHLVNLEQVTVFDAALRRFFAERGRDSMERTEAVVTPAPAS